MKLVRIQYIFFVALCCCTSSPNNVGNRDNNIISYPPPKVVLIDTVTLPEVIEIKDRPAPNVSFISHSPPKITKAKSPILHFTNFGMQDGVSVGHVFCGFIDSRQRIWFATAGGADCYDGATFKSFNANNGLPSSYIMSIAEDKNGHIWFATGGSGVSRYDGKKFFHYTTQDGLADNTVFDIMKDSKGSLWFSTENGANWYDGKTFKKFDTSTGLPENNVNKIREDRKGNLWFMTFGGGLSCFKDNRFLNYSLKDGLPTNYMLSMAEDSKGMLWFGTYEGGLCSYDGQQFTNFTSKHGLPDNTVSNLVFDEYGDLWLGTLGGVSRMHGSAFINYTEEEGLAQNFIRSVTADQSGNIWFGTMAQGISRYNGRSVSIFTKDQGLPPNTIWDVAEDKDGNIWVGIENNGFTRYDGSSFTNFSKKNGLPQNQPGGIRLSQNGDLWFGTETGGISRFDGKGFTNYSKTQGLISEYVYSIGQDKKGDMWIATDSGVSHFDGKKFTNFSNIHGLPGDAVYKIIEQDSGRYWFATGKGLCFFDGKRFTTYTKEQGLVYDAISDLKIDKSGNLWIATQKGISRFDGNNFLNFTIDQGLPDNLTYCIGEDDQGVIWIGTNQGFCGLRFTIPSTSGNPGKTLGAGLFKVGNEKLNSYLPSWEIYNLKTGYPFKDLMDRNFCIAKKGPAGETGGAGIFWINVGDAKLIRFDPNAVKKNLNPIDPFLSSVKIDGETINWYGIEKENLDSATVAQQEVLTYGKKLKVEERDSLYARFTDLQFQKISPFFQVPEKLQLPFRNNHITFEFGAVEINKYKLVRYQYRLEGSDENWSTVTDKTSAEFDNLQEGSYTFLLKARNPEGVWSEPLKYSFVVLPPWWRTWLAYLSYVVFFGAAVYSVIQWRTRSLKRDKQLLEEKVNRRTKQLEQKSVELAASLENLKSAQSQLIQSEKMASLGELTAGIAHEIQNPLNFVNNFSELNKEMLAELNEEMKKGNYEEAQLIAAGIADNEEKINHHGKRADAIVKGMLQHSPNRSSAKELTNINTLADEYLRLAYHGYRGKDKNFNATLKTEFDENIGKMNIVPQDIARVFLNLYNNAFYAVNERKKREGYLFDAVVEITTTQKDDYILVSVKDNGNGMEEKIIAKIFQPFFTTKPTGQGTGLGLSLSYDIIKAHGGELSVKSNFKEGAEFVIKLPVR